MYIHIISYIHFLPRHRRRCRAAPPRHAADADPATPAYCYY